MRILLILLLSFIVNVPLSAEVRSPYRAIVDPGELRGLRVGESTIVRVVRSSSIEQFRLTRIASASPRVRSVSANGVSEIRTPRVPRLYQGSHLRKKNGKTLLVRVAGALYKGKLTLDFHTKRGRAFSIVGMLPSSTGSLKAKVFRGRKAQAFGCGVDTNPEHLALKAAYAAGQAGTEMLTVEAASYNLELDTAADKAMFDAEGSDVDDTNAAIATVINAVDAIYASQLSLNITINTQTVYTNSSTEPVTATEIGSALNQYGTEVNNSGGLDGDAGMFFTGDNKTFQGNPNVAGLAFKGVICSAPQAAFSIVERFSLALWKVVIAHELGHNFDMDHDDATSPSIMNSSASTQATSFSDFSVGEATSHLDGNDSCVQEFAPNIRLDSFKLKAKKNRLVAAVTPIDDDANGCDIYLYGADAEEKLTGDFSEAKQLRKLTGGGGAENSKIKMKACEVEKTTKDTAFIRARVVCGEHSAVSDIVQVPANKGKKNGLKAAKVKKALRHWKKRLKKGC